MIRAPSVKVTSPARSTRDRDRPALCSNWSLYVYLLCPYGALFGNRGTGGDEDTPTPCISTQLDGIRGPFCPSPAPKPCRTGFRAKFCVFGPLLQLRGQKTRTVAGKDKPRTSFVRHGVYCNPCEWDKFLTIRGILVNPQAKTFRTSEYPVYRTPHARLQG